MSMGANHMYLNKMLPQFYCGYGMDGRWIVCITIYIPHITHTQIVHRAYAFSTRRLYEFNDYHCRRVENRYTNNAVRKVSSVNGIYTNLCSTSSSIFIDVRGLTQILLDIRTYYIIYSHCYFIVKWTNKKRKKNRINPKNGHCMSACTNND